MRSTRSAFAVAIFGLASCSSTPVPLKANDLAWLAGTWSGPGADGATVWEEWTEPAHGLMRGEHRLGIGEQAEVVGRMQVIGGVNGIVMLGSPVGQPSRDYAVADYGSYRVRFEDERSDFPRVVSFERSGDVLSVRFSGVDAVGSRRELSWKLNRVGDPPR